MLSDILLQNRDQFVPVLPFDLEKEQILVFDFSVDNIEMVSKDLSTMDLLNEYISKQLLEHDASLGVGGYLENRFFYQQSPHFGSGKDARTYHLGVDLWAKEGTPVLAPIQGSVHSFQINETFGDYGATIILEHQLNDTTFYTLYGHLSHRSLNGLAKKQTIEKGQNFATLGIPLENGGWPPHLHFQVITDMLGKKGDFPGVSNKKELDQYKSICPNPNLILKIPNLL